MTQPEKKVRPFEIDSERRNKTTESISPLHIDKNQLQKYHNKLNGRDRSITQRGDQKQNHLTKVKSHRVVTDSSSKQKATETNIDSLKTQIQKKKEIIEKQREYIKLIDQELWIYKKSTLYQKDEEIQRKNMLIQQLQSNEQDMMQQIQELQNRINQSYVQMNDFKTNQEGNSQQEKDLKKQIKHLQKEVDQQKFIIQKVHQLCGEQDQEMNLNQLMLKFDEKKTQLQVLELRGKEQELKINTMKRKKDQLKHQLESEQLTKQKQDQEIIDLRVKVEKILKSKEKLVSQLSEVNQRVREVSQAADEISQLKEMNQDYEKKVAKLGEMLSDLQKYGSDLQLKLTKKDQELSVERSKKLSISSKQGQLELEVARYKHEISDVKLELQLEQQQRLKFERDAQEQAQYVEKLLKSKAKLAQQIMDLNKEIDGVTQLVREIATLREQKSDDERKIQELINKLTDLQRVGQELQQKLSKKDQELNIEKNRKLSLNQKQALLETEIVRLKHDLVEQEKSFKKEIAHIQKEKDEISHQQKEIKKTNEKLSHDNQQKINEFKQDITALQRELKEQKQKNEDQHDYILRLQQENKKYQADLAELRRQSEEQIDKLKHKLEDSQKDPHRSASFSLANSLVVQNGGGDMMDQSVSLFLKKMTQMKDKLGKNTKNLEEFGKKFGLHLNNARSQKTSDTSDKEVVDEFNDLLKEICQQIDSMNEMQRQIVGDLEKKLIKEGEKQRGLVQQNIQLKLENHKIEELTNLNKELQASLDSLKKEKQKLALDNQNLEALARRGSVNNGHHGSGLQLPQHGREHRKSLYLLTSQSAVVNSSIHDKQMIDRLEKEVQQLKKELQETHQIISTYQAGGTVSADKQINYLNKRVQDLQNQLKQKAVEIDNLQKEHDSYRVEIEEEIDKLENEVEERDERIQELLREKLQGQ